MKILKVEIAGFGKWRQKTVDFEEKNQLFYGANEAGKSTLYQFILTMFFGFASKGKKKKDYTPQDGSAFGGKIWIEHPVHGKVVIERYKQRHRGKARVHVLASGMIGDERLLEQLLAPVTKELFQQVFTFQQEQLSEFDHLQEKELHDALISLGITGSSKVFQKRQEYYQCADNIYKKKAQKLVLNKEIKSWQALQKKVVEKQKQEEVFGKLVTEEQALAKEQIQLKEEQIQLDEKISMYKQQELNYSLYEEWHSLKSGNNEKIISEEDVASLKKFYQSYQQLLEQQEVLEATLEKQSGLDQQSTKYYFYLEKEDELKKLANMQSEFSHIEQEYIRINAEIQQLNAEQQVYEQRWQWSVVQMPLSFEQSHEWTHIQMLAKQYKDAKYETNIRKDIAEKQAIQIEEELNHLEERYPFLIQKTAQNTKSYGVYILYGISLISVMVVAGFFSLPWRYIVFLSGVILLGGLFILKTSKKERSNNYQEVKGSWQEKLDQLDRVNELIAKEELENTRIMEMRKSFNQALQHLVTNNHLKEMNTFEYLNKYGNEVTEYTHVLSVLHEKENQAAKISRRFIEIDVLFSAFSDWLPLENRKLGEKFTDLATFIKEMDQRKFARSYQQNTLLQQQLKQLKTKQKKMVEEISPLMKKVALSYPSEIPALLQKMADNTKNLARLLELEKIMQPLFPENIEFDELRRTLKETIVNKNQLYYRNEKVGEQRQRVQIQLEALQKDGSLDQLYQQRSIQTAKVEELMTTWGAYVISGSFLGDLSIEMSQRQLPQLLEKASKYIKILTSGRYQQITFAKDVLCLVNQTKVTPIHELSTGTKDQLIMAIRFGYLSLEAPTPLAPIIIDDGWLHYDSVRKEKLAELLARFGEKYQVICFSSDKEMVSYYQRLGQSVKEIEGENYEENS